ncbi:MAG: bifunctional adenosylcobinamide kinase/adenosylcobinamide-phosphate guanylyltransferase [Lachnospiraceae bacterium]|nr:bifunctional adenosylcobinamide kinase/adenosylcobinamide-phosphate guanylyltransferase [Lachnospiraceae bacterium]
MILVVGGYSQGKLDFVKEQFHVSDECVFDSALPDKEEREKLISEKKKPVIHNLHKWIRKRSKEGGRVEEELASFIKNCPDSVIICDEIGNGIVPMDPFERVYRERTGRILTDAAKEAEEVWRVICAIGQRIK